MPTQAYVGLPGSGKSYSVVENVILPALKAKKRVWTNIPMNAEELEKEDIPLPVQFEIKDIEDNPDYFQEVFEPGALMIIDECWRLWPAGIKANLLHQGHKSFFAEHRHMVGTDGQSTEIILVTQDLSQIAAYMRSMIDFTYRTVKLSAVGMNTRFRVDVYEGYVTGQKPPKSSLLRQIPGKYKKEVYKYYQSQTMNQSNQHGSETVTDKRNNILNSKLLLIGAPIFVVLMVLVMINGFNNMEGMYTGENDEELLVSTQGDQESTTNPQTVEAEETKGNPILQAMMYDADISIIYNQGDYPYIDYKFAFDTGQSVAHITLDQLRRLGFIVQPVARCVALIMDDSNIVKAMCKANVDDRPAEYDPVPDIGISSSSAY